MNRGRHGLNTKTPFLIFQRWGFVFKGKQWKLKRGCGVWAKNISVQKNDVGCREGDENSPKTISPRKKDRKYMNSNTIALKLTAIFLLSLLLVSSSDANGLKSHRAIPDDNLAYPVLVMMNEKSVGSGFYINTGKSTYFVTARHVIFKQTKTKEGQKRLVLRSEKILLLSYAKDLESSGLNEILLQLDVLNKKKNVKYHKKADVAVIWIGRMIGENGKQIVELFAGVKKRRGKGIVGVHINNIKKFEDVLTGNDIFVFGYPSSLGMEKIPQIDYARPLLRKGIIAGKNRKLKTIILDAPIYRGNSGGPVLEVVRVSPLEYRFPVIGVVTQFIPYAEEWRNIKHGYSNIQISNSGYSVVVPMDTVLELLEN